MNQEIKDKVQTVLNSYCDIYGDFYITKENLRYAIQENIDLLFECIEKGDKLFIEKNGIAVVFGYSDNQKRKYIKILSNNKKIINNLLQDINYSIKETLYIKIKKNNPLRFILEKNGFKIKGYRGKELLFYKINEESK